ncbi:50S ribosomal protein L21 [Candidatus Saccharibacteria bacterium CPR2]|nr:50S ribosomal protein L21 [Candidatus Saccharibacteria bacterium CPR2]
MKKAVISAGGKQYMVASGDVIEIELQKSDKKLEFFPLLVVDEEETSVGKPFVEKSTVKAEVIGESKGEKVTSIRFKSKKRVHKTRGHRQNYSKIRITAIE